MVNAGSVIRCSISKVELSSLLYRYVGISLFGFRRAGDQGVAP